MSWQRQINSRTRGGRLSAISAGCRASGEAEGNYLRDAPGRERSRPDRPHPEFYGFVKAAVELAEERA